jgi:hypothetical protein
MRRARQRSLMAITVAALLVAPRAALAFHAGSMFDKLPGAGGGGRLFYTGSPRDKGWNCRACHTDAPGNIQVRLDADQGLFDTFTYEPTRVYQLTATMVGEHAGLGSSTANFNGLAVSIVDAAGSMVGSLSGPADDFYGGGGTPLVTAGKKVGQTSWSFRWTAPERRSGPITIYIGAVDGNAANATTGTLTDPWGDDVFTGALQLGDGATASSRAPDLAPFGAALSIAIAGAFQLGARRKRAEEVQ